MLPVPWWIQVFKLIYSVFGYVNNVPSETFRTFWYKGPGHRKANVFDYIMSEDEQVSYPRKLVVGKDVKFCQES